MSDPLNLAKRAISMPKKDLVDYLVKTGDKRLRKYTLKFYRIDISDKKFLKALGKNDFGDISTWGMPPFFINPDEMEKSVKTLKDIYPDAINTIVQDADDICDHIFQLLGSEKINLGPKIDWNYDFKSGYHWSRNEYYLISSKYVDCYLKKDIPADVKVPWELSRCQHFITLGKAYWYTSDEKYASEFVNEIESWIDDNPVELGVNWACTMDVAIRAVNWIWGYYFFYKSKTLTKEFRIKLLKSLFLHGRHISNNLEYGTIRGNHYLSDIVGLVYLGIFFKNTIEGNSWLEKGVTALNSEMRHQVYEDGVDFEGSISYHRLVTELFLSSTLLCIRNNIALPDWYMRRLEKMIEFIMYYTKPDGSAPQIGDNDDGRLQILSNYGAWDRLDHRYLLSAGAILFNRPDLKAMAGMFTEECYWLMCEEGLKKYDSLPGFITGLKSRAFEKSGFYIMRNDKTFMLIDAVPLDPVAPSGHKHNSRLSFELSIGDSSIVDPGAYIYTANKTMRNLFRSTAYHNTVVVDNEEQNRLDDNLFAMRQDASVKVNRWYVSEKYDLFDAEHYGYMRLNEPVIHQRLIYFDKEKNYFLINDLLRGDKTHGLSLNFHLPPVNSLNLNDNKVLITGKNYSLVIRPLIENKLRLDIEDGFISYMYGKKINAKIIKYTTSATLPYEFLTLITMKEEPSQYEIDRIRDIFKNGDNI